MPANYDYYGGFSCDFYHGSSKIRQGSKLSNKILYFSDEAELAEISFLIFF